MYPIRRKAILSIFILCIIPSIILADIRDYIVIIKPVLPKTAEANFNKIADYLREKGQADQAKIFRSFVQGSHSTGFVITDSSGENYIITNSHVVAHAEKVNVEIQKYDGTVNTYTGCPVLYLDDEIDIAVLQFPNKEKVFMEGLTVDSKLQVDGIEIWAAGYPGLLDKPVWQLTKGTISNQQAEIPAMIDPKLSYIIQHTASIDPGNSGSPLLIKDNKSPIGYSLIGINTWMVAGRKNAFFALPAKNISLVLERMKKAESSKADPQAHKESLKRVCKILASELASEHPNLSNTRRYISYAFVDEVGFESYSSIIKASDKQEAEKWERNFFFYSPIETIRSAIYFLFWNMVQVEDEKAQIEFKEINFADEEGFLQSSRIRTIFMINGKEREIVWAYERGQWRIIYIKLTQVDRAYGKEIPIGPSEAGSTAAGLPRENIGIGINGTIKIPENDKLSKAGVFVDIPLSPHISIIPGINYCFFYDATISIDDFIEIYILLKTGYALDFGTNAGEPGFFLLPYMAIGTGVNFTLIGGANIPFFLQGGVEIGYIHFSVGLYFMSAIQIISDLGEYWENLSSYQFPYLGLFVKYYF